MCLFTSVNPVRTQGPEGAGGVRQRRGMEGCRREMGRTEDFQGLAVARGAGVRDDDVVEGGVAFAEAGEADFEDHVVVVGSATLRIWGVLRLQV